MSWRGQIANGYPWKPLAFVALMASFMIATVLSILFFLPAERAVIDHGTKTKGHAVAWKRYTGRRGSYNWRANITWTDAEGHPRERKELDISDREAAVIGNGSDVEIQYIGDQALITDDLEHRVRDESNAPLLLGLWGIGAVLGLALWRRRLREWRAPKPVQW